MTSDVWEAIRHRRRDQEASDKRLLAVLAGLSRGLKYKEVAAEVGITQAALQNVISRALRCSGASGTPELLSRCAVAGLLPPIPTALTGPVWLPLREQEVLELSAKGYSYADIGITKTISSGTVKFHAQRLFRTLKARNIHHAIALYRQQMAGFLPPGLVSVVCIRCRTRAAVAVETARDDVGERGWYPAYWGDFRCTDCTAIHRFLTGSDAQKVADVLGIPAARVPEYMMERGVVRGSKDSRLEKPEVLRFMLQRKRDGKRPGEIVRDIEAHFGVITNSNAVSYRLSRMMNALGAR